uniref:PWWP domain-containing protein n=1 Tax=Psilocybe cubensis TaxID=181762 RepID=A0A8H8CNF1_PSICU
MEDTTSDATLIPRRKAARAAAEAVAIQVAESGSEPDVEASKGKRRAGKQSGRSKKKAKMTEAAAPINAPSEPLSGNATPKPQLTILKEATSIHTSPKHNVVDLVEGPSKVSSTHQRKRSGLEDLSDLTDLTSMSSDERPTSPEDVVSKAKRLAKPFPFYDFEDTMYEDTTLTPTIPKASSSKLSKPTTSKASTSKSSAPGKTRPKPTRKIVYQDFSLDSYVWTLVNPETLDAYEDRPQGDEKGLWWPGKVQRCRTIDTPLEVRLFGKDTKVVQIFSPTKVNTIPQPSPLTKMKFKNPTYVPSQNTSTGEKEALNLTQDDIIERWQGAIQDLKRDADIIMIDSDSSSNVDIASLSTTDDDLPEYVSLSHPASQSSSVPAKPVTSQASSKAAPKNKGKGKEKAKPNTRDWQYLSANEPDMLLTIPGELVLAKEKLQTNIYWPARIEEFVPSANPSRAGKYKVTWVDSSCQEIPRGWFYTSSQSEFATCLMGKFESFYVHKEDDPDEDDLTPPEEDRSPSPVPLDPPPSREDFKLLDIRHQFTYTKEILRAIMDGRYTPTREKHDDFVKGGKWRKNVANSAAMWGLMDPKEVKVVDKLVRNWCLRDDKEDEVMDNVSDISPQPIVLDSVQDVTQVENNEAPAPPEAELALGDNTTSDIPAVGTLPSGSSAKPPPTFIETVPNVAGDIKSSASKEGDAQSPLPAEAIEPDPTSPDYVYPDSAMRFEPSPFPRPLHSSSPSSSSLAALLPKPSHIDSLATTSEAPSSPPPSSLAPTMDTEDGDYDIKSDLTAMAEDQKPIEAVATVPKQRNFVPFKSLTKLSQIEYCSTILVPESVRQILLWRSGDRTQMGLLGSEEEQVLYDKGTKLLSERDWVFDVKRLREVKVAALKSKKTKSLNAIAGNTTSMPSIHSRQGSSSRPRRNLSIQNYQG